MSSGSKAVDLLVSIDHKTATEISNEINNFNLERREEDQRITQEALTMISGDTVLSNRKSTVVFSETWHKGVIGIVASRLIESYYRPTIVLTASNGFLTGSARSVQGFDLYQALEECSDLLETFGGHMYAAGLTLKRENFETFSSRFEEVVDNHITPEQLTPRVTIDEELDFDEITDNFANILKQMEPFGPDNMAPVFLTRHVRDTGSGKVVGVNANHLKLELIQDGETGFTFPAIAFNQSHKYDLIRERKLFDICYTLEENEFRGNKSLQLNIKDIKVAEE